MNSTNYPKSNHTEPFEIEHIDPLGQGVSKINDKILFVRKSLPGEKGHARILKKKKGVLFGEPTQIETPSKDRRPPACPHFQICPGCHFLHTDYGKELAFKLDTFARDLSFTPKAQELPYIQVHHAPRRLNYRTRIQLHFDKKSGQMGFVDPLHHDLIAVPDCQVPIAPIREKLRELYQDQQWKSLVPQKGHLEIALDPTDQLQVSINQPYSAGGFRQVFPEMNSALLDLIDQVFQQVPAGSTVLDLFGGSGNLSQRLGTFPTLVVDSFIADTTSRGHQEFAQIDLYATHALSSLEQRCTFERPPVLILDPPRTGLKELDLWVNKLRPPLIIYVSCHHQTQLRDLRPLWDDYEPLAIHLLDFFPSTFHFETMIVLKQRKR